MAAYFTLENKTSTAVHLKKVESVDFSQVIMHRSRQDSGKNHMEMVSGGLTIPAHGQVEFLPSGYHLMLIGRKNALQVGDSVILNFYLNEKNADCFSASTKYF